VKEMDRGAIARGIAQLDVHDLKDREKVLDACFPYVVQDEYDAPVKVSDVVPQTGWFIDDLRWGAEG